MTETINLVDRCKFVEKDLSSSGSMIVEIDGWIDGWTQHESERNWHLEYKMVAWLHSPMWRNITSLSYFDPFLTRILTLKWIKVSISIFFSWSEMIQVDPSWSDPDWQSKLIRSDFCTCLFSSSTKMQSKWRVEIRVNWVKICMSQLHVHTVTCYLCSWWLWA